MPAVNMLAADRDRVMLWSINATSSAGIQNPEKNVAFLCFVVIGNFLGAGGNLMVLIATLTYRPLRFCSSSPLIAHCAVLDLLRSVLYPSLCLLAFYAPYPAIFPPFACRYIGTCKSLINYSANWAFCCLAGHRFCGTVFPYHHHYLMRRSAIRTILALPWIVSGVLSMFAFFEVGLYYVYTYPWAACVVGPLGNYVANLILGLGTYLPCAVSCLLYVTVFIRARAAARAKHRRVSVLSGSSIAEIPVSLFARRRCEMSRMLVVCSLWMLCSSLPIPLAISWFPVSFASNLRVQMWTGFSQFLAGAVNPAIFILISKTYRTGFVAVLTGRKYRSRRFSTVTTIDHLNLAGTVPQIPQA